VFRGYIESLQSRAATSGGAEVPSLQEAQTVYRRAIELGYSPRGGVDTNWVGGRHINLDPGPAGGASVHLPVPEGFVP
ncbi:MAG: hypothetical protein JXB32_08135, partial [Deltaproteobacteria bacterium]|nr:hypothetical protein [Deltaproteobacteria bacterium]